MVNGGHKNMSILVMVKNNAEIVMACDTLETFSGQKSDITKRYVNRSKLITIGGGDQRLFRFSGLLCALSTNKNNYK